MTGRGSAHERVVGIVGRGATLVGVLFGLLVSSAGVSLAAKSKAPDFTRGDSPEKYHDYTLGPTGARGWIYGKGTTEDARQILVTKVDRGTPADGVLEVGDVILGVGGRDFDADARRLFAEAVTEAETTASRGALKVARWRKGARKTVTIRLEVTGSYSDTSVVSSKSTRIIEDGGRHLAKKGIGGGIAGHVNALGLLATGEARYLPQVRAHAAKVGAPAKGMASWYNGYANLFLTEYHLVTKDRSVLPKIRALSKSLVEGQNVLGLWGHGYKEIDGSCSGYGALNQAGLVCALSLALAQKCRVDIEHLDRAVERSRTCFRWYTDKGSIPYGYHDPWHAHACNGKNGSVAVFFDIAGDAEAASFFSKMCTAATARERDMGHTGSYFNTLWGPLGAARAGDRAAAAHLKELRWLTDLSRLCDGSVIYQGNPGNAGGHKHGGWDMTGALLLAHCTPRRKLYITGKGKGVAEEIAGSELRDVAGAGKIDYGKRSASSLMRLLGSWSPTVRTKAGKALAAKGADVQSLVKLLRGRDRYGRYGACRALEAMGNKARGAVDDLVGVLEDEDVWLRCRAIRALGAIADPRAIPPLLKVAVRDDPENDPLERVQNGVGLTLFYTGRALGIRTFVKTNEAALLAADRKLLIPALKRLLLNANGRSRSEVARFCEKLPWEDVEPLLPELMYCAKFMPPGCKMFSWNARLSPYAVLCRHGVKQVLDEGVAEWMLLHNKGGAQHKWQLNALNGLKLFGGDAREYLPLLTKLEEHIAEVGRGYGRKYEVHKVIPPMIPPVREALSSGKGHPDLKSIKTELLDYSAVKGLDRIER
jgi:HEAT repeat protein